MSGPPETLTLTPSSKHARLYLALNAVMLIVWGAYIRVELGLTAALVAGAIYVVFVALVWAHLARSRVGVTAEEVTVYGLFQRRRSRDRVAGIVRATVVPIKGGPSEQVFLLDSRRELVLRINGAIYSAQDLDRLVEVLQVPCDGPDQPVTPKQLHGLYPGLVSWAERRPYMLTSIVIAALLVVAGVAVGLTAIFWSA
ncbi:hypothetical protein [Saccharomonospora piscinae]|uniref:hypothetical protein n=1 Tax=Saccharomonospora piscinae TaxID=687388 RepID=UPI0004662F78|nr:hypothetical protein [Saccharomonospora piscinae]